MDIGAYIDKKIEILGKQANLIKNVNKGNSVRTDIYSSLIKESVYLTNQIKASAIEEGCEFGIDKGLFDVVNISVSYENEITHIEFDNLPPLRTKGYTLNERDTIRRVYLRPLAKAGQVKRYDSKVVMLFRFTYAEESSLIDYDNYELKPIIDEIASKYLIDDSPEYVSYYMDYRKGKSLKTDIYLIPEAQFLEVMQQNFDK